MEDNATETTSVMPPVEPPVPEAESVFAELATEQETPVQAKKPATGTSKTVIIAAAVALGLVMLGGTFASGAVVGSKLSAGRNGLAIGRQGEPGAPGAGMNGKRQRDGMRDRDDGFEGGHGGRGEGMRGGGQAAPPNQTVPQSQTDPRNQSAPSGSNWQIQ